MLLVLSTETFGCSGGHITASQMTTKGLRDIRTVIIAGEKNRLGGKEQIKVRHKHP